MGIHSDQKSPLANPVQSQKGYASIVSALLAIRVQITPRPQAGHIVLIGA